MKSYDQVSEENILLRRETKAKKLSKLLLTDGKNPMNQDLDERSMAEKLDEIKESGRLGPVETSPADQSTFNTTKIEYNRDADTTILAHTNTNNSVKDIMANQADTTQMFGVSDAGSSQLRDSTKLLPLDPNAT